MKIKHFLAILALLVFAGCAGIVRGLTWHPSGPGVEWAPLPPEDWSAEAYPDFSEEVFLAWQGEDIGEAEVGDADETQIYRLKARQYLTDDSVSKVWVDLDRDWLWDLRIQYDEGHAHLWYSEDDNEIYGERLRWTGSGWEPAPVPREDSSPREAPKASIAVVSVLGFQGRAMSTAVIDAHPSQSWKLDVYPGNDGYVDYAELDADRDGEADQRWQLSSDPVTMELLGEDGGSFTWTGTALVPR